MSILAGQTKQTTFTNMGLVQLPELYKDGGFVFEYPFIDNWGSIYWGYPGEAYFWAKGQKLGLKWSDLSISMSSLREVTIFGNSQRWGEIESYLFTARTLESIESNDYQRALDDFKNNITFVTGSFEEGSGLYMYKYDNTSYKMDYLHGFYQTNEATARYFYHRDIGENRTYTVNDLSSVFWYWDGEVKSVISMLIVHDDGSSELKYGTGYNTPVSSPGFAYYDWKNVDVSALTDPLFGNWDKSLLQIEYPVYPFQVRNTNGAITETFPDKTINHWLDYDMPDGYVRLLGYDLEVLDPDNNNGTNTGGGDGGYPTNSDTCKDPDDTDLNTINVVNSGLVTLYNPSMGTLQNFANFLFTGITDAIADQLKKLLSNPLDYVLFCSLCKFTPSTTTAEEISFCGIGSGVSAPKIPNQFHTIDCGTVHIPEPSRTALDFNPHSKIQLYLPYCGIHELSDDVIGADVRIKYNIDLLSGSCVASVEVKRGSRCSTDAELNSSLYKFNGNCYLTMPLSATDWRGAYNSMVQFAGGIVSTAAGNPMAGIGEIASAVTQQKVAVARSGQGGSNYGHMSDGKPYFILNRPIPSIPTNFKSFEGYVSNIRYKVSQLKGYTEIDENTIWTDNFGKATEKECQRIKEIMNGGVYL